MTNYSQPIKFIVIGSVNTLFGYSLYTLFIFIGMAYPIALLLSTILGVLFNFKTTGKIVFGNSNNGLFVKFAVIYGFVYLFNMALIKLMHIFTSSLYLSGFLALIPAAIAGFFLNKYIVFREDYETN